MGRKSDFRTSSVFGADIEFRIDSFGPVGHECPDDWANCCLPNDPGLGVAGSIASPSRHRPRSHRPKRPGPVGDALWRCRAGGKGTERVDPGLLAVESWVRCATVQPWRESIRTTQVLVSFRSTTGLACCSPVRSAWIRADPPWNPTRCSKTKRGCEWCCWR